MDGSSERRGHAQALGQAQLRTLSKSVEVADNARLAANGSACSVDEMAKGKGEKSSQRQNLRCASQSRSTDSCLEIPVADEGKGEVDGEMRGDWRWESRI